MKNAPDHRATWDPVFGDLLCPGVSLLGELHCAVLEDDKMQSLPKEAWEMHVTADGELMVRDWFAPAVAVGWSTYSALPNEKITAADLERHGIAIDTVDGRAVFKKRA